MAERILLVDDEKDFLDIMSERLKYRGMDVATAGSAREAISKIALESYDVIVLDLQMQEMDGLEALKVLRTVKPELQVILLTGHVTLEKGVEAMKLGAMDLMEKPADITILEDKIRRAHTRKMILVEKQMETRVNEIILNKGW
jgi:DNA-binding NtrC family response regulator